MQLVKNSFKDYTLMDGINASRIKRLYGHSPYHYKWNVDNAVSKDSPAMKLGRAIHSIVLEKELFDKEYRVDDGIKVNKEHLDAVKSGTFVVAELPNRRGNAWADFKKQHGETPILLEHEYSIVTDYLKALDGVEIITAQEYKDLCDIREAVLANPDARLILETAQHFETSYQWDDSLTGLRCKARADIIMPDGTIYDLKSVGGETKSYFVKSGGRLMYPMSAAFYVDGMEHHIGVKPNFGYITITTEHPYFCCVIKRLSLGDIEMGRVEYQNALGIISECMLLDEWPTFDPVVESISFAGYSSGGYRERPDLEG